MAGETFLFLHFGTCTSPKVVFLLIYVCQTVGELPTRIKLTNNADDEKLFYIKKKIHELL